MKDLASRRGVRLKSVQFERSRQNYSLESQTMDKVTTPQPSLMDSLDATQANSQETSTERAIEHNKARLTVSDLTAFSAVNFPVGKDFSHDALALTLGEQGWDENAKYVSSWRSWLFWTGTRWERDGKLSSMTKVREFLRGRARQLDQSVDMKAVDEKPAEQDRIRRWANSQRHALGNKSTVNSVEFLARSNPASIAEPDDFDVDKFIIATPRGVVDLQNGQLRPARRTDMVTKLTAFGPAPQGTHPERWLHFLNEIFDGDSELISFMQRAAGYALTGSTREHKLLFLCGGGRNGKSVFLNTLHSIWGDYARRAAIATFISSHAEHHPTDLAGLRGARLAVAGEVPRNRVWDEQAIKDLTGGDTISARFMRGDFFDFTPELTLMIAGNTRPSFRGVDEAIRSRVVLVPFSVTIPSHRRDHQLSEKLLEEAPAILRWAISGAVEWNRRGLDVPASLVDASNDYFDAEDIIGLFLADETEKEVGHFTAAADLHDSFSRWCTRHGHAPWTQAGLVRELRERGFAGGKSNGRRGLKGIRLSCDRDKRDN